MTGVSVFARIVVGVDGTDWGFEALHQALVLAPKENAVLRAVTALDTAPAIHAGLHAAHFAELLTNEAEEARATAETIIAGREGCEARVVRGKPVDVLRRERDELQATLMALGGRRSSRFLGIMLGDTGTELVHDAACSVLLAYPPDAVSVAAAQDRRRVRWLDLRSRRTCDSRRARARFRRRRRSRCGYRRQACRA